MSVGEVIFSVVMLVGSVALAGFLIFDLVTYGEIAWGWHYVPLFLAGAPVLLIMVGLSVLAFTVVCTRLVLWGVRRRTRNGTVAKRPRLHS
jgi:MFS family permease